MKKVLSTVAALGLIAGLASTAAAVEFKMSGKYMVEGAYLSDSSGEGINPQEFAGTDNTSDAYFMHTFEIKPTMKVNDKVSMASVIRLADRSMWGNQADGDVVGNKMSENTTSNVYVHQLYMDYASPVGTVRVGRTPAGTYGTNYMDFDQRGNRVMWWPSFLEKPWSTLFYIQKTTNNNTDVAGNLAADADNTSYVARVYYNTDSLDSGLHYQYTNNMTDRKTTDFTAASGQPLSDVKQALTAYAKYKMDNYFVNGELTHFFGSKDYDVETAGVTQDQDYDSWAGMLQVGGKFDALTPSLMYFYAQGQDRNDSKANGGDIANALGTTGTGDMFEPLYILTGRHTGLLNNDIYDAYADNAGMRTSGVHAVVLAADYAVSNQLTLHGAIGWAKADEVRLANQDDSYGWEYNLGAAYKLLDNLTYEAHFGYLDAGDYFNEGGTTDITNNVYILTHSLTMTF